MAHVPILRAEDQGRCGRRGWRRRWRGRRREHGRHPQGKGRGGAGAFAGAGNGGHGNGGHCGGHRGGQGGGKSGGGKCGAGSNGLAGAGSDALMLVQHLLVLLVGLVPQHLLPDRILALQLHGFLHLGGIDAAWLHGKGRHHHQAQQKHCCPALPSAPGRPRRPRRALPDQLVVLQVRHGFLRLELVHGCALSSTQKTKAAEP
mmetsp:Transcript_96044/g.228711  ORF Transcript_96044/g.228711 Transcript_96044/m.228711 type:complete len:203 (+) Transcript_96044:762-1370(+)